jgi:hypothetical protein
MLRLICAAVILSLATGFAPAVGAPKVPKSAKKLTGSEIVALYDRTPFRFKNFTAKQLITGTFLVNFTNKTASGTYAEGKNRGTWTGKVRIKGDQFCRKINKRKEGCVFLYVDGHNVYEVNANGVLESMNRKQ